jgi:16S rRNA (uracil1498-N3)-methyltransferase
MTQRYFVENPIEGDQTRLVGPEAHHLSHVMRAAVGDELTLFDGSGDEFTARVIEIGRSDAVCEIVERRAIDREAFRRVVLGVALPKRERQRWLVEKAVELGCHTLAPLTTARSVSPARDSALNKLRRGVIEASKQCGRNRLMLIESTTGIGEFLRTAPENALRLLAHPAEAVTLAEAVGEVASMASVYIAIGPEGGFTDEEVALAKDARWQTVDLGSRILRTETAAVATLATLTTATRQPVDT